MASVEESVSQYAMQKKAEQDAAVALAISEGKPFMDEGDEVLSFTSDALQLAKAVGDDAGAADAIRLLLDSIKDKGLNAAAVQGLTDQLEKKKSAKDKKGEASMLVCLAEVKLAQRDAEEASTLLAQASARFKEVGDKKMEAESLLMMVKACLRKLRFEEGVQAAKDALALFQASRDKTGEVKAQLAMAAAHISVGSLDAARTAAETAEELSKSAGNKKVEISAKLTLADVYLLKEWPRQASQTSQAALNLSREIKFTRGEGMALNTLVLALAARGEAKEAQKVAEEGLARFVVAGDTKGQISANNALVRVLLEKDEPDAALTHAERELELLSSPFDEKQAADVKLMLALIHLRRRDAGEAHDAATKAQKAFQSMDDKLGQGVAAYTLTFANLENDLDIATESANQALSIFKDLGDKRWEAGALLAIADTCSAKEEHQEAKRTCLEAVKLFAENRDVRAVGATELKLAELWMADESTDQALQAAQKAQHTFTELGNKKGLASAIHLLARIRLSMGEPDTALQLEMDARKACRKCEDRKGEAILFQTICDANFAKYATALQDCGNNANDKRVREANRKAFKAAKDALGLAKRNDNKHLMGIASVHVARMDLSNGRFAKALKAAQDAGEWLGQVGDRAQEAVAMALQGECLLFDKDTRDQAEQLARKAMYLASSVRDPIAENYAIAILNAIAAKDQEEAKALPQAAVAAVGAVADLQGAGASSAGVETVAEIIPAIDHEEVSNIILHVAKETVGEGDDLHMDTALMDAGMDSLSAVAFRNSLMRQIKGVNLPSSLMFDYPSIIQIADFVVEESKK